MSRDPRTDETKSLSLPPMGRGMQIFSLTMFFLAGVALTAFVLVNPLELAMLPALASGAEPATDAPGGNGTLQLHQCPMHLEVIEEGPANCPICGMALQPMNTAAPDELYQCPMHPDVIESGPADCPICGMDLVVMRKVDDHGGAGVITIDPVQVQNIGVVSRVAQSGEIARTVRTVGILDFNADNITWVNTKYSGWIEKVHVNYVGQEVRVGQPLFEVYSPELVNTQEEYLRALEYRDSLADSERFEARRQADDLLRSARDRLSYWDVSEDQVLQLETDRKSQRSLTVRSTADGVVAEVMDEALEGMFIKAGMNLYKIADMTALWVHADVYESDLPWVRVGQPADIAFRHEPDRVFRGKILFLYPELSKETRTLKICVEVPNEQRRLRAGMYTDVVIHGPTIEDAVLIPNSAVLRSGERDLVFIDLGDGRFAPREVQLGIRGEGDRIQITRGVEAGESVVTQAQFMLDSESRVQEAIAKFVGRGAAGARGHEGH